MGVLRHKAVVPKLCCKLESLGLYNKTKQNKKMTSGSHPQTFSFLWSGVRSGICILKSSSGTFVGQLGLGITGNRGKISGEIICQFKKLFWNIWSFNNLAKVRERGRGGDFSNKRLVFSLKASPPPSLTGFPTLAVNPGGCGPAPESVDSRVLLGR